MTTSLTSEQNFQNNDIKYSVFLFLHFVEIIIKNILNIFKMNVNFIKLETSNCKTKKILQRIHVINVRTLVKNR